VAAQKMKKGDADLHLDLTKTRDIAAALGQKKKTGQIIVGFALETENEIANAEKKLIGKNFDLVVLNSLNDSGAGFGHDTNKVTFIDNRKQVREFPLKSKKEVARDIVEAVIQLIS
jgi:phosphopantothenoylcysteine decarboxylase/phosphopantothenate--cysteine ligase